jgi:hypothetical protein
MVWLLSCCMYSNCGKLVRNTRVIFFVAGQKAFFRDQKTFFCSPHRRIQGVFFYYLLMTSFLLQLKRSVFENIPWNVLLPQVPDCSHLFTTVARVFVCAFYDRTTAVLRKLLATRCHAWCPTVVRMLRKCLGILLCMLILLQCSVKRKHPCIILFRLHREVLHSVSHCVW